MEHFRRIQEVLNSIICFNNHCLDEFCGGNHLVRMASITNNHTSQSLKFDSKEQEVFLNLWKTYDKLKAIEDELFGQYRLSAQQYNALRLLESVYPDSMRTMELGRRLVSRCPDTTRMLDRLGHRKLTARKRLANNRRVVEVAITSAGLSLLEDISDEVRLMHRRQLGHMNRTDLRTLTELLKKARLLHEAPTEQSPQSCK